MRPIALRPYFGNATSLHCLQPSARLGVLLAKHRVAKAVQHTLGRSLRKSKFTVSEALSSSSSVQCKCCRCSTKGHPAAHKIIGAAVSTAVSYAANVPTSFSEGHRSVERYFLSKTRDQMFHTETLPTGDGFPSTFTGFPKLPSASGNS